MIKVAPSGRLIYDIETQVVPNRIDIAALNNVKRFDWGTLNVQELFGGRLYFENDWGRRSQLDLEIGIIIYGIEPTK